MQEIDVVIGASKLRSIQVSSRLPSAAQQILAEVVAAILELDAAAYVFVGYSFVQFNTKLNELRQYQARHSINLIDQPVQIKPGHETTLLTLAAARADRDLVKYLVGLEASPNLMLNRGEHSSYPSLLISYLMARDGTQKQQQAISGVIAQLIESKADPNCQMQHYNRPSSTLLHMAAYYDDRATIKVLLAAGASLSITDHHGLTPLAEAISQNHLLTVDALVKAGASLLPGPQEMLPLLLAMRKGHAEIAIYLILQHYRQGKMINAQNLDAIKACWAAFSKDQFAQLVRVIHWVNEVLAGSTQNIEPLRYWVKTQIKELKAQPFIKSGLLQQPVLATSLIGRIEKVGEQLQLAVAPLAQASPQRQPQPLSEAAEQLPQEANQCDLLRCRIS